MDKKELRAEIDRRVDQRLEYMIGKLEDLEQEVEWVVTAFRKEQAKRERTSARLQELLDRLNDVKPLP